ncbi:ATP-binding domain-containing protein, partial [Candidatus Desantisbacteria bacterium]|nr:ATP-binding domain-containing protein [Candidatus Desantisbacteria bacterium]
YEKSSENNSIDGFLEQISLSSDIDRLDQNSDCVRLMTLHNAKGLEFPIVFITGTEDGIFPHGSAFQDDNEMEEERRLCYVGITRAQKQLFFTYTCKRRLYGREMYNSPSRFLKELPANLINDSYGNKSHDQNSNYDNDKKIQYNHTDANDIDISSYDISPKVDEDENENFDLQIGQKVRHKLWGVGKIKDIYGKKEDAKIVLMFERVGIKKLALKYANLEKV